MTIREDLITLAGNTSDWTKAKSVEVTISDDGTKIWVDVDGRNCFRAYNVERIVVYDGRGSDHGDSSA